jgi:hypothetical protein
MAFDPTPASGGGEPREPWCASCKAPITRDERSVRVHFDNDPHGFHGLSGEYHEACGKPFASMARVINLNWLGRF